VLNWILGSWALHPKETYYYNDQIKKKEKDSEVEF
jgi:hypothetical protein